MRNTLNPGSTLVPSLRSRLQQALGLTVLCTALPLTACIYDPDNICQEGEQEFLADERPRDENGDVVAGADPDLERVRTGYCVCKDNHREVYEFSTDLTPVNRRTGCEPCPPDSTATPDAKRCVCNEGFAETTDGRCERSLFSNQFGLDCVDATVCTDEGLTCGGAGYCTTPCTSNANCPTERGFVCDGAGTAGDPADDFCRRPPVGEGDVCATLGGSFPDECTAEAPACAGNFGGCLALCTAQGQCSFGRECCRLPDAFGGFAACLDATLQGLAGGCVAP